MRLPVKLHHLPQRMATGAFILNSGISKLSADEEAAAELHGFAAGTYPFLAKLKPKDFVSAARRRGDRARLGAAAARHPVGGGRAGLAAFSGGLLGLYVKTPGMRKEGTPLPTQQGIPLAKDVWMLGVGLGLVIDDLTDGA